jgi:hypothetical protein
MRQGLSRIPASITPLFVIAMLTYPSHAIRANGMSLFMRLAHIYCRAAHLTANVAFLARLPRFF